MLLLTLPFLIALGVYLLGHFSSDSSPPPKLAIQCPTCGVRSVETARKVAVVRGMLIIFRYGSVSLIGCCECVSAQVKQNLGQNALLGWWSMWGVIATPFCLLQNIFNLSTRSNSKKLNEILSEVGISYNSVKVGEDGMPNAQRELLKTCASILKSIAEVEGTSSTEWQNARAALVALSDDLLTEQAAELMLQEARPLRGTVRNKFDQEQRLVLLGIAIEIAASDGSISADEETAIFVLGSNLGLDEAVIRSLLSQLSGGGTESNNSAARKILGVSSDATVAEIRSAYKKLMLKNHPDRVRPQEREEATRISAEINAAYDLLLGRSQTGRPQSNPPKPKTSPKPKTPPKPKKMVCAACQKRLSSNAKFCGFCGTKKT
jgi:DnaJ-domain-containing protein 1/arsenate reductase-like glutaredoxin family protein